MTLAKGVTVQVLPNPVHPALAGRLGTVVTFTRSNQRCGETVIPKSRSCGGNPIVEVPPLGRFLLTEAWVVVVEDA